MVQGKSAKRLLLKLLVLCFTVAALLAGGQLPLVGPRPVPAAPPQQGQAFTCTWAGAPVRADGEVASDGKALTVRLTVSLIQKPEAAAGTIIGTLERADLQYVEPLWIEDQGRRSLVIGRAGEDTVGALADQGIRRVSRTFDLERLHRELSGGGRATSAILVVGYLTDECRIPLFPILCDEVLSRDSRVRLEKFKRRTTEQSRRYDEAAQLRRQLEAQLQEAEKYLDQAAAAFLNLEQMERDFAATLDKARTAEEWLGLAELGAGLLKGGLSAGIKAALKSGKYDDLFLKSPHLAVTIRRWLLSQEVELSPKLAKAFREMDRARLEAVVETLNSISVGNERLSKYVKVTGSGAEVIEIGGDGVARINDRAFRRLTDGSFEVNTEVTRFRGPDSDFDLQVPGEFEEQFNREFTPLVNAKLEAKGIGKISKPGELKVNTFSQNLSVYNLDTPAGAAQWARSVSQPGYLANPDAFRTSGAQKLADGLTWVEKNPAGAEILFKTELSGLDGADLAYEMANRAELIGKTGAGADPQVFSDIVKAYERAKYSQHIATTVKSGRTVEFNTALYEKFRKELEEADSLYKQAKELKAKVGADAELAQELLKELRSLKKEVAGLKFEVTPGRNFASRYGRALTDLEESGQVPGDFLLTGIEKAAPLQAVRQANRRMAEDLQLFKWLGAATDQRLTSPLIGGGILEAIGSPWATIVTTGAILSPNVEKTYDQLIKDAVGPVRKARDNLLAAEKTWSWLQSLVLSDAPGAMKLDAPKGASPDEKDCFERLAKAELESIDRQYRELAAFVYRIKVLQARFNRAQMTETARVEYLKIPDLDIERTKAEDELGTAIMRWVERMDRRGSHEDLMRDAKTFSPEKFKEIALREAMLGRRAPGELDRVIMAQARYHKAVTTQQVAYETYRELGRRLPASLTFRDIAKNLGNVRGFQHWRRHVEFSQAHKALVQGIRTGEFDPGSVLLAGR